MAATAGVRPAQNQILELPMGAAPGSPTWDLGHSLLFQTCSQGVRLEVKQPGCEWYSYGMPTTVPGPQLYRMCILGTLRHFIMEI